MTVPPTGTTITLSGWILVLVQLGLLIWLAWWAKRFSKSVADFTVAGRGMGMWLGLSCGISEGIGLVSIANSAQLGFTSGLSYIWLGLAGTLLISIPLFGILGLGIERYRATKVQTLPQYYEMRYSRGVRIFAGVALGIGGVLNMAIFPIVESNFLVTFLGLPATYDILGVAVRSYSVVLFILLALALLFTLFGGMVTVLLTEYVQSIIMFVSLGIISWFLISRAGIGNMTRSMEAALGPAAFNPLSSGGGIGLIFVISYMLGSIIHRMAFPPALQRMSAAESPKVVRRMYLLSVIFGQGRSMTLVVWGIAALALMGAAIPAGVSKELYTQVVAAEVIRTSAPALICAIALAGFIFASISTNDTYLLSWSSVITNDIICVMRKKPLPAKQHIRLLQLVSAAIAVFIFFWGIYYTQTTSILQYMYLTGAVFGGCGLITWFGLYWRRASSAGAWMCLMLAVALPVGWILFSQHFGYLLERNALVQEYITNDNVLLLATLLPAFVLVLVSLLSNKPTRYVDYGARLKEIKAEEMRAQALAEQKNGTHEREQKA